MRKERICHNCGTTKSYCYPSRPKYEEWRFDKDKNYLCLRCWNQLIYIPAHKEQRKIWRKKTQENSKNRTFHYKEKKITVKTIVRTGLCVECNDGIQKFTHLHHEIYDDNNFLKHTIELCPRHHMEASKRLGQFHGRWGKK